MIPIAKHTAQILDEAGLPLPDLVSVQAGMDESWSPRVQADIVLHREAAAALPERMWLRLRATYGSDMSLAAITAWSNGILSAITGRIGGSLAELTKLHTRPWNPFELLRQLSALTTAGGNTVATLTTLSAGRLERLTEALRQPGGAYAAPAPQLIEYLMHRRDGDVSLADDLVTVQLASAEVALHDYRRTIPTTYVSTHTSLRTLATYVAGLAGASLMPGADVAIPAGSEWEPGKTAWEYLHAIIEAVGWQLYAAEDGRYVLAPRAVTVASVGLDRDLNLIAWDEKTEPVHDAVIVEYTSATPPTFDIYAPPGSTRPLYERRDSVQSAAGAANEIALRASQRARTATATATSMYAIRPLQRVASRVLPDTTHDATVESLTWAWPDSTMRVRLRDITTI